MTAETMRYATSNSQIKIIPFGGRFLSIAGFIFSLLRIEEGYSI